MPTNIVPKRGFSTMFTLIIIVVIALGILAFIVARSVGLKRSAPSSSPVSVKDQQVEKLQAQSNADDVNSIEKDIDNTNLNDLDSGTTQIENDLNSK